MTAMIEHHEFLTSFPTTPLAGQFRQQPDLTFSEFGEANLTNYPNLLTLVKVEGNLAIAGLFGLVAVMDGTIIVAYRDGGGYRLIVSDYGTFKLSATLLALRLDITIRFVDSEDSDDAEI